MMKTFGSSAAAAATTKNINPLIAFENKRDAYGFAVRPQHVQRYREYANIYKEEEEERSDRWKSFLERQAESAQLPVNDISLEGDSGTPHTEEKEEEASDVSEKVVEVDNLSLEKTNFDSSSENATEKADTQPTAEKRPHRIQIWSEIRPLLRGIEEMMSIRVKKKGNLLKHEETGKEKQPPPAEECKSFKVASEEDSEDEFYDAEKSDPSQDSPSSDSASDHAINTVSTNVAPLESSFPWKEELEVLVRGGVPMALRGELWQAFVGVRARRVERYYQDLLANENHLSNNLEQDTSLSDSDIKSSTTDSVCVREKWKGQIEKDLPRTFPGHPALDDDGRNALR